MCLAEPILERLLLSVPPNPTQDFQLDLIRFCRIKPQQMYYYFVLLFFIIIIIFILYFFNIIIYYIYKARLLAYTIQMGCIIKINTHCKTRTKHM